MKNCKSICLGNRQIGFSHKPFIIAEVAQAHDGSLGLAHSFIEECAKSGADAIKFQTHIALAESTPGESFRINFSYQDSTRFDYWKRMEFTSDQWQGLKNHADSLGLIFLSSPFSTEAVEMLDRIGVPGWKIGSGEVSNPLLLEAVCKTSKPVLLSSGMSSYTEIKEQVRFINEREVPLALFQCTSQYPVKLGEIGLNVIDEMRKLFHVPVGLSDHSGQIFPGLAALARGADLLEVHVNFHKGMFGPDTSSSITFDKLKLITEAALAFYEMNRSSVDKDSAAAKLQDMKKLFGKSVALLAPQLAGTKLSKEMLTVKKPGTGIPASELHLCIGRKLVNDVLENRVLTWNDISKEI